DHHALYTAESKEYTLPAGQEKLQIPLRWESGDGLVVTKIFTFRRGDYTIDVDYQVENKTAQPWQGRQYRQLQRSSQGDVNQSRLIYTYTGGVIYSEQEKYEKISFDDMKDKDLGRNITGGWAAMIQHYFVAAWLPDQKESNYFYSKKAGEERFILGMVSPDVTVAPGATQTLVNRLYVGPKIQDTLESLAPGLELTVDYGFLTVIAKPIFWLLRYLYELIGNWGWAIAAVTLCIKLVFFKLSEASYRSMANMRRLQPKMLAIKERYGEDRQRMSQAMMELYKKEKINPFGGCLPMLVQIPVFISLYWVLLESVELRQAPFILWIHDLAAPDPFYVLPLLMGITMFIQMRLNPAPPDPIQAKIMMALPFVFPLFFAFFPSGLVLYWVVNNVLSISQQYVITRRIDKAATANA
ncbi:MAG: preprotein translocase subunit YidC, partial [Halothiobacillaceae bacterium]